jgi:predicted dehydrogenase
MNKIRIGILGCASIARRLAIPALLELPDLFTVVAIASRTKEKAEEMAIEFNAIPITGYANIIDRSDIDAIYMPLPTGLHQEWITKALNAGKHVFCEKSLAMNHSSAANLCQLAKEKGLLLMENFMFRYHSQHTIVKQLLDERKLGDIRLFRSQFGFPPLDKNNFRYDQEVGGGALLDAGAYTLRAAQWFLGSKLEVMSAALYIDTQKGTDIYGNMTLMNVAGTVAQLSFGFDNFYKCNYEFWGSNGNLTVEKAFTPKPLEQPFIIVEHSGNNDRRKMEPDNQFAKIWKAFYQGILSKDHDEHLIDIINQSALLDQIKDKAIKKYL